MIHFVVLYMTDVDYSVGCAPCMWMPFSNICYQGLIRIINKFHVLARRLQKLSVSALESP